jgi:hypothetical protein
MNSTQKGIAIANPVGVQTETGDRPMKLAGKFFAVLMFAGLLAAPACSNSGNAASEPTTTQMSVDQGPESMEKGETSYCVAYAQRCNVLSSICCRPSLRWCVPNSRGSLWGHCYETQ